MKKALDVSASVLAWSVSALRICRVVTEHPHFVSASSSWPVRLVKARLSTNRCAGGVNMWGYLASNMWG